MQAFHIPVEFVLRHVKQPSWSDVDMGLRNGWLNAPAALEIAIQKLADNPNARHAEVMVAAIESTETAEITEQVERLAKTEFETDRQRSKRSWLYLTLTWLYEIQVSVADPLAEVEEIYSDFGYLQEVARFVRYMPPKPDELWPQPASQEEATERLMRVWGDYVNRGLNDNEPEAAQQLE